MSPNVHLNSNLSNHSQIDQTINKATTNFNPLITCCYFNIRSIVNKLSLFQSYVYSSDYDIVCLTETWLTDSVFDQEILPTNYSIFRKDRPSHGGGVLIAIKDTIPATVIPSILSSNAPEIVTVKLNLRKTIVLICAYLPPCPSDSSMDDTILNLTQVIEANPSADTILVGDFNLPNVQWDTLSSTSSASCTFCDFVFDNSLTQLIDQPTHIQGNILDLVLSNSNDCVTNLAVAPSNWINTDHFEITFQISQQIHLTSTVIPKYVFDFPKADYDGILSYLCDFDYNPCLQSQDVESIWFTIKNSILTAMNIFIPKVRLRRHQFPCWYTPEARHLSKCLRTSKKRFSKHPTSHLQQKINDLELQCHNKILQAKSNYESNLVCSFAGSRNGRIYDYIRSLTKKSSIPTMVSLNNSNATTDVGKAQLFNAFFHSVFTDSSFSLPNLTTLPMPPSCICTLTFSDAEVFDALSSLDPTKASGCDGIGPKLIKHCAAALYIPLHQLFSLSLSKQSIPNEWKCHSIIPLNLETNLRSKTTDLYRFYALCLNFLST